MILITDFRKRNMRGHYFDGTFTYMGFVPNIKVVLLSTMHLQILWVLKVDKSGVNEMYCLYGI